MEISTTKPPVQQYMIINIFKNTQPLGKKQIIGQKA
jgi:hypothetical protein